MELNDLIMLGACSLLADKYTIAATDAQIRDAVFLANRVWDEVIEQS